MNTATNTQAEPATRNDSTREALAELGRCVAQGRPLTEFFGTTSHYLDGVERKAFELYRDGQYDKARVLVQGVRALDESRYYPHLMLGDLALHEGRLEEATQLLERARELRPDNVCVLFKLATAYGQTGRTEPARDLLERVVADTSSDDRYHRRARALRAALARG